MDIQEQIDQFLQIPEIKEIFSDHDIHWHVGEYSQGWYFDFSVPDYEKGFFLGAWNAWQAAKAQAVPEGFVLVPKEMPKSFDEGLYVYSNSISIVDECSEGFIPMSDINHAEVWKLVIEAQEPTND